MTIWSQYYLSLSPAFQRSSPNPPCEAWPSTATLQRVSIRTRSPGSCRSWRAKFIKLIFVDLGGNWRIADDPLGSLTHGWPVFLSSEAKRGDSVARLIGGKQKTLRQLQEERGVFFALLGDHIGVGADRLQCVQRASHRADKRCFLGSSHNVDVEFRNLARISIVDSGDRDVLSKEVADQMIAVMAAKMRRTSARLPEARKCSAAFPSWDGVEASGMISRLTIGLLLLSS